MLVPSAPKIMNLFATSKIYSKQAIYHQQAFFQKNYHIVSPLQAGLFFQLSVAEGLGEIFVVVIVVVARIFYSLDIKGLQQRPLQYILITNT